ncbi:glycine cleavage system H protein, partial [Saitoella complicata NRRL Y-17804]
AARFESTIRFTKDHEWIRTEDGKTGTIGITEFAAKALGDVTFVEFPEVGQEFSQGDQLGAVESVKAATDIYSPLTGTILSINEDLAKKPSLINKGPLGKGWLCTMEIGEGGEVE